MKIVLTAEEFFSKLQSGKSSSTKTDECRVFVSFDGKEKDVGSYPVIGKLLWTAAKLNKKEKLLKQKLAKSAVTKVTKPATSAIVPVEKPTQYKKRRKKHASPNRTDYSRGKNVKPFHRYTLAEKEQLDKFFKTKSNHYSNGSLMISKVREFANIIGRTPAAVLVYFSTHGYRTHRYKGTIKIPTGGKK